jgi:hypothetical protein
MLTGLRIRTVFAMFAMAFGVAFLSQAVGENSPLLLVAFIVGMVLVSLTSPAYFGWTDEQ